MNIHDFKADLSASYECSKLSCWTEAYRYYFPEMVSSSLHEQDRTLQRAGVDRKIFLSNGKVIGIDEKARFKNYGDIALEEWSVFEKDVKGWTEKSLLIDYVAYLIVPSRTCYLLPFQQTKNAWLRHKDEWKQKYKKIVAYNNGYRTIGWAIPPEELFAAIYEASFIKLK